MADRSITIKPFARRAAGSLAQRVLFTSIALLILPLLIHTFLLYKREYRENVDDALVTMRSLAESRSLYVEQTIENQEMILQALSDEIPETSEARQEFLLRQAKEYEIDQLIYVAFADQKPVCDDLVCRDPTFRLFFSPQGPDDFVFINPDASDQKDWLYVGKKIGTSAALLVATPAKRFLERLTYRE